TGGFIKGTLYMLGFTDTSCDYSSFYGKDTRFLTVNSFVHDHQLSFITLIGGLHNMTKCDCVNQTGFANPDHESQMPTIYWEDNFNKLKVKFWQKVEPIDNSPFKEVWFIGERVL
ncbi:MAG: hypothetical protein VXW16_01635, partial [Bacteroidota bacterium]|nr:hypothetical protein [Bacteroidota bacterium]